MRRLAVSSILALLMCFLIPFYSHAGTVTYTYQTVINTNDSNFDQLLGINNSGTIAGYFGDGVVVPNNGFTLVLPSSFTAENFTGAVQTQVIGINNTGETVGFYIDTGGVTHGFTFSAGTFTKVDNPNTTSVLTQLLGVNDSAEAAGYWQNAGGTQFPFTVKGTTFTGLDSLLPSNTSAQATDVNNGGWVSGFFVDTMGVTHGFLLEGTTEKTLDYPGATATTATGLSNTGFVDGFYVDSSGVNHGFVYDIATGTYTAVNDPSALNTAGNGTILNGINDKGQLVGFYMLGLNSQNVRLTDGFVATPTPEPAALLLLATGVFALTRKLRKHGSAV